MAGLQYVRLVVPFFAAHIVLAASVLMSANYDFLEMSVFEPKGAWRGMARESSNTLAG